MINQKSKEYKNWIRALSSGKLKKAKGVLDRGHGRRCCLGHACYFNNVKRVRCTKKTFGYEEQECYLPSCLRDKLNITRNGEFTYEVRKLVTEWIRKNKISFSSCDNIFTSLSLVNDYTNATPKQIGQLIQYLARIEKKQGIKCFRDF